MKEKNASSTAFTVLQGLLHVAASDDHGYLIDKSVADAGRRILQGSPEGRQRLRQIERPWSRLSVRLRERLLLPGITVHYALRKRYVEEQVRKAVEQGCTQVVILGAGFDPLAWRFAHERADVQFIEIDHPATQKQKATALVGGESKVPDNLCFLSVDFTQQSLQEALQGCPSFDGSRHSIYVCEGVLMYLDEPDIDAVFEAISTLSGEGAQLLFTAVEPAESPRNNVKPLLFTYLKLINEPIRWTASRDDLEDFVKRHGCDLVEQAGTDELKSKFVKSSSSYTYHYGEHFGLCRFLGS